MYIIEMRKRADELAQQETKAALATNVTEARCQQPCCVLRDGACNSLSDSQHVHDTSRTLVLGLRASATPFPCRARQPLHLA